MQQWGLGTTEDCQTLTTARGKLNGRLSPPSAQAQKLSSLQRRAAAPGQYRTFTPVPPRFAGAEKQRAETKTC